MKIDWKNHKLRVWLVVSFAILWPLVLMLTVTAEPTPLLWGACFIVWFIALQFLPFDSGEPSGVRAGLRIYLCLGAIVLGIFGVFFGLAVSEVKDLLRHFLPP